MPIAQTWTFLNKYHPTNGSGPPMEMLTTWWSLKTLWSSKMTQLMSVLTLVALPLALHLVLLHVVPVLVEQTTIQTDDPNYKCEKTTLTKPSNNFLSTPLRLKLSYKYLVPKSWVLVCKLWRGEFQSQVLQRKTQDWSSPLHQVKRRTQDWSSPLYQNKFSSPV